ncbi:unnamed protein product, partial [Prorocentrum cordatum]
VYVRVLVMHCDQLHLPISASGMPRRARQGPQHAQAFGPCEGECRTRGTIVPCSAPLLRPFSGSGGPRRCQPPPPPAVPRMSRAGGPRGILALAALLCLLAGARRWDALLVPSRRALSPRRALAPARGPRVGCSFFGAGGAAPAAADLVDGAPSWEDLRARLEAAQTPAERAFRRDLAAGTGPPNAMANLRVFGGGEEAAKQVTLFRDSASWCPYCQKVWILLEEKQIPYNVKRVNMNCYGDKPPDFLAMQPSGQIPAAIINGAVLRSSDQIIQTLLRMPGASQEADDALDPFDRPESNALLSLDRTLGSGWLDWVRGGGNGARFMDGLQRLEEALSEDESGPYFLGERFSLIDIMYTPYFERAVASLAYYLGFNIRDSERYPAINRWLDALDTRPSIQASKSDYYTHCWDLPPQIGGCNPDPRGAEVREQIDGGNWKLPLQDSWEPDWGWVPPAAARREAVERLLHQPQSVARFAARGAAAAGFPPAWAELADPNARPAEEWVPAVELFLRHAAALLLADGADGRGDPPAEEVRRAAADAAAAVPQASRGQLAGCLEYLQKRVGVPRDMSQPAARRLRAVLGELAAGLRA